MLQSAVRPRAIGGAAAWRGPDLATRRDEWIYILSEAERREVRAAFAHFEASGRQPLDASQADFPLPTFGATLQRVLREIDGRRGFLLMRGLPIEGLSEERLRGFYWGIGLYLGVVIAQSGEAELIGDVRDRGDDSNVTLRGYRSKDAINYHTDAADLVLLLCRRTALRGGASRLTSSVAVHDHIAATRPDLLEALYQPLPVKRLQFDPAIEQPWFMNPIFGQRDGHFASRFQRGRILNAAELPGSPGLTDAQREGIELVHQLAGDPAFYLDMEFARGDIQFVINHQIYHARTTIEDSPEPDLKRHVLRMWLATPTGRPLPEHWREAFGNIEPATIRGGLPCWRFPERFGAYHARAAAALGMRV
ncbi:MAG: TauD/TfdA family dioxygenase [Proteobacteria bacterium]|nr:TauD/TfdA family dioxygenase [Pseudomonadota bacterium]